MRADIARLTQSHLRMVSVHLTDFCNSKCDFCVVNSPMVQRPIATETLVRTVEGFAGDGAEILNIHGGEATISKALFPVLSAARRIGLHEVHLQTNGIRLSDRQLVDDLIDAGVRVFVISLHGHTAAVQEEITRTPGSFDRILAGIENVLSAGALALSCDLGVRWQNISALHPSQHAMASFDRIVVHPRRLRETLPPAVRRLTDTYPDTTVELEGFPACHAPLLEQYHIDRSLRDIRMAYHEQVFDNYETYMDETQRRLVPGCFQCREVFGCKGVYHAYATHFDGPVVWPLSERA
jgi:sulfatase maturation enzyme AslB (radical SAM superfamily)